MRHQRSHRPLFCAHDDCLEDCTTYNSAAELDRHTFISHTPPNQPARRRYNDSPKRRSDHPAAYPLTEDLFRRMELTPRGINLTSRDHAETTREHTPPVPKAHSANTATFPPIGPKQARGATSARRFQQAPLGLPTGGCRGRRVREAARDDLRTMPRLLELRKRRATERAGAACGPMEISVANMERSRNQIQERSAVYAEHHLSQQAAAHAEHHLSQQAAAYADHHLSQQSAAHADHDEMAHELGSISQRHNVEMPQRTHSDLTAYVEAQRHRDQLSTHVERIAMMIEAADLEGENMCSDAHERVRAQHHIFVEAQQERERKAMRKEKEQKEIERRRKRRRAEVSQRNQILTKDASYRSAMERAKFE